MRVTVHPALPRGSVRLPASKSLAHRALVCAALASGTSHLSGVTPSQDREATLAALRALGARIDVQGGQLTVRGVSGQPCVRPGVVDCGESGSTLRFMIPLFALSGQPAAFCGHGRLMQRSQSVYQALFAQQGLPFVQQGDQLRLQGPLQSGDYAIDGFVSSQFISGLLFALPLCAGNSTLRIRPPFQSRAYVDLTLEMLERFGVQAGFSGPLTLQIPGGQKYQARELSLEGDYSQSAFFGVLGAAAGEVDCRNLNAASRQGDQIIVELLARFGARVSPEADGFCVGRGTLRGTVVDVGDCPDLMPPLAALAALCTGETHLVNAARLRDKESDRLAAMETELRRLGVEVTTTADEMRVAGGLHAAGPVVADGHNDHRVVMSLAVLGACGQHPITIEGAQAVGKSYPHFFQDLRSLGVPVEVEA